MSIVIADIKFYKSVNTDSTGGAITATEIADLTPQNLFDNVTVDEAEDGVTHYRKFFVKNVHSTISWQNVVAWILSLTESEDDEVEMGVGTALDDDGSRILIPLTASSHIALVASAADVRTVTLIGENTNGAYLSESKVITGTTEVLSTNIFSKLYSVSVTTISGTSVITIKQGTGGITLGTIAVSTYSAILYSSPLTKAAGFELSNIAPSASKALWLKRIVQPASSAYSINKGTLKFEGETA